MSTTVPKDFPIGRIFRIGLGLFFVSEVLPVYLDVPWEGAALRLSWSLGLLSFYLLLQFFLLKVRPKINRVLGALLAFVPFAAVFFIGYGGPAATGALTFLTVSLIVAGIRGDAGCEVMSIPAIFSRSHTPLACLLFSPLDWCEQKMH